MAIGKASDFKIYQEYLRTRIAELIAQNGLAFGAASAGAIQMTTASKRGDYEYASFFKNITGLVTRRDNTSTAGVTDLPLLQDEIISVKLSRKIGPVAQTRDAFRKMAGRYTETEFTGIVAEMAADAMQNEMLNTSLAALVAALKQQSGAGGSYVTESSLGVASTASLVSVLAAMGDAANKIVAWVMHSKPYYNIVGNQITANIMGVSNFAVSTGSPVTMGRPVVVTDSSALTANLNSPDITNYYTIGLVAGAAAVENTEEEEIVIQDVTGLETLVVRYQGEYAYNLGLKGFKWDVTNGAANPLSAAITTGTNWDVAYTSVKNRAGILLMTL